MPLVLLAAGGTGGHLFAAEADDRRRPQAREQPQCLHCADAEHRRRARERQRVTPAHGRTGDDVNVARRKRLAVALGTIIGGESGGNAPPAERLRKRLGGKQMPAGSAGGQENERHAV